MIKLHLRQANHPEVELKLDLDIATIGRAAACDVVVDQPYVSKRHLRILRGVVVVDLGSSNGTFVEGRRLSEPTLLQGGEIRLGDGEVYLRVQADDDDPRTAPGLASAPSASAELERLRARCAELESENRRARARPPDARGAAPEARSGEAPRQVDARPGDAAGQAELLDTVRQLRAELERARAARLEPDAASLEALERLRRENLTLRERLATAPSAPPPQPRAIPAPALAPAPLVGSSSPDVRALLALLAEQDAEARGDARDASPEEFVVVQQFKLVRHVERLVTRLAGDFIQRYHANTMLPDVEGNLRELIARCVDARADAAVRKELLDYFAQLSRWLVAALGAHRSAAARFAAQLKLELSEERLTAGAPIPAFKRMSGQAEAELWRRSCAHLRELTPDAVEGRLEQLARESALELLGDADARAGASPA